MKPSNFEICTGVFICQICRHYRNKESKEICMGCKHLADFLDAEPYNIAEKASNITEKEEKAE